MRILWLTNIPSPYRVDFFNELGLQCDLTVIFEKKHAADRHDSWKQYHIENFKAVFLEGISMGADKAFCPRIITTIQHEEYDFIFVTNFSDLTGILAISYLKFKSLPYIIESDGAFSGDRKGIKEKIKKFLLSSASLFFSTADEHDRYYIRYGAHKNQIIRYPFTSIHSKDILRTPITDEAKHRLRKALSIKEQKVLLAVGQYIHRKGYDLLLQAMRSLPDDVGCYLIGGQPTTEYLNIIEKYKIKNVHFIEFKSKEELARYYMAADIFVHPTREDVWGLVINEAMSKGLPIITTDKCIAGLELIKNNNAGTIVPSNDTGQLIAAIQDALHKDLKPMNEQVLKIIRAYTIESMAKKHIEALTNGSFKK